MASDKKRRKQIKLKNAPLQPRVGRHPDGDRRQRGGLTADQARKNKITRQQFEGVPDAEPPHDTH